MEPTLFSYIWRYSRRQQLVLLAMTVASFPILYLTLEIPKRIVNDAISANAEPIGAFGFEFSQLGYLGVLCGAFLLFVLLSGLIKMQINTYKGVVAERLLRRFRFQLINRILRFPLPHFRRTSQGELISMVTGEAEPLGGLMGNAIAQPVFQAGQMLTILMFLFIQNIWFGLAAIALIPLQAYVIPMLQWQINLLNKERVQHVRKLSERLGESVAGVEDLRANNGVAFVLADFTTRLGDLFKIRYEIYQRKFFMKFLNNFINQLTPFFFFSIGGYLVIQGELTVGALVAALAAYKDLSSPWKELLAYYNQLSDMSLRYHTIIDQFAPRGMIDEELFNGRPDELQRLQGPIRFHNVTVSEPSGAPMLSDLNFEIPKGAMVAVQASSALERRAFAQLMSRNVMPSNGQVLVDDRPLEEMHQTAIAARVGVATPGPYLFNTTIENNVKMALRSTPQISGDPSPELRAEIEEALAVGNSADPSAVEWLDPSLIGLDSSEAINGWWLEIIQAIGSEDFLFERCLHRNFDPDGRPQLAEAIVALRPKVRAELERAGLAKKVHFFEDETFNPGLDIVSNVLFATPRRRMRAEELVSDPTVAMTIRELGIEDQLLEISQDLVGVLIQAFGDEGADHPLFQHLSGIDASFFKEVLALYERYEQGDDTLHDLDRRVLLTLPFLVSAEELGEAFPAGMQAQIRELCINRRAALRAQTADIFSPLEPSAFAPGLSVYENALFGKVSIHAGAAAEKILAIVSKVFEEAGLKGDVALLIGDAEAGLGGSNLPPLAHERIAVVRATLKKPDILVLDRVLPSHEPEARQKIRKNLRRILPDTTIIFLEPNFKRRDEYDLFLEIQDGRVVGAPVQPTTVDAMLKDAQSAAGDLRKKLKVLESVTLFEGLKRKQLRLLAYASHWVHAEAGEYVFRSGDPTDGAYVFLEGTAELRWPHSTDEEPPVTEVETGRVIGDLSVIRGTNRDLDLRAVSDLVGLRIGKDELMTIIQHDSEVAVSLLQTVSGYLVDVALRLNDARQRLPGQKV